MAQKKGVMDDSSIRKRFYEGMKRNGIDPKTGKDISGQKKKTAKKKYEGA